MNIYLFIHFILFLLFICLVNIIIDNNCYYLLLETPPFLLRVFVLRL